MEEKDKVSNLSFSERPKELGNRWQAIGEEGRKKWNDLARERKDFALKWHDESSKTKKQKKSESNSDIKKYENNNDNENESDTENEEYE